MMTRKAVGCDEGLPTTIPAFGVCRGHGVRARPEQRVVCPTARPGRVRVPGSHAALARRFVGRRCAASVRSRLGIGRSLDPETETDARAWRRRDTARAADVA